MLSAVSSGETLYFWLGMKESLKEKKKKKVAKGTHYLACYRIVVLHRILANQYVEIKGYNST